MRGWWPIVAHQGAAPLLPSFARRATASVRARSTIGATAVVAVGGIAGSVLVVLLLQRALLDTAEANATTRATDVARLVSTSDVAAVRRDLVKNTTESQLIQVLGPDGTIIASSSSRASARQLSALRPAPGKVEHEQRDKLDFLHTKDTYAVTALGVAKEGVTRTVVVAASIGPQSESVEQLITYLLVLVPAAILLVAAGTWTLVGRALRQVEAIRSRVASIRAGHLSDRVLVPTSHDEVARLASTMNEMLDRLEAGQRAQRSFVADASHELRSPLSTLSASIDVVGDQPTAGRWREMRSVMSSEVERMGRLVDDLLLLAKVDDRDLPITFQDVDLDDVLVDEVRRLRSQGDVAIEASLAPVRVAGDRSRLAQAVRNLVENAAVASDGRVGVSVAVDGSTALLVVEDDGHGIPEDERDRVFDRFVRLDESRSRDSGGSGLGLAIVKEVIAGHDGTVTIVDSTLGGARFEIRLPLVDSPQPPSGSSR